MRKWIICGTLFFIMVYMLTSYSETVTESPKCSLCKLKKDLSEHDGDIGFISLNTFYAAWINIIHNNAEINVQLKKNENNGFSAFSIGNENQVNISLELNDDRKLDLEKVCSFLCESCLREIRDNYNEKSCGIVLLDSKSGEIQILHDGKFTIGEFSVTSELETNNENSLNISIVKKNG